VSSPKANGAQALWDTSKILMETSVLIPSRTILYLVFRCYVARAGAVLNTGICDMTLHQQHTNSGCATPAVLVSDVSLLVTRRACAVCMLSVTSVGTEYGSNLLRTQ